MQIKNGITVSQHEYVESLEEIKLSKQRAAGRSEDLGNGETEKYRALIGQLIWLASQSRPDISFDVCQLSKHAHKAKVENILYANRVVRKVRASMYSLFYPAMKELESLS